jgi:hypothetical protein
MNAPEYGTPEFWAQSRPDAAAVIHGEAFHPRRRPPRRRVALEAVTPDSAHIREFA